MGAAQRILVPLADGFEETEAVTIIDVLRRAGLEVVVAGLVRGSVRGSHGIELVPDVALEELDADSITMAVLPGGMPGTRHLMASQPLLAILRRLDARGAPLAAICAAPLVLQAAGVIEGLEVTSHPSVRAELTRARVVAAPSTVRSGRVTTSQGVGSALEFALALVAGLCGAARAEELARAMVVPPRA